MANNSEEYLEIDLLKLLKLYWQNFWALLLAAVISAGAAFSLCEFVITPKYESDVLLYVNNSNFSLGSTSFSFSSSDLSAAQSLVDTYIVILQSRTMLNDIKQTAGLSYELKDLSEMITSAPVDNTEVFRITVESTSPAEAELIANTIADLLPDRVADIVDGSSMRVVDFAVVAEEKSSPETLKISVIAAFLGVIVLCAIITIKELSDTVIHDEEYLTSTYDMPILAIIPDLNKKSTEGYYRYST